jgi:hypothetical protein
LVLAACTQAAPTVMMVPRDCGVGTEACSVAGGMAIGSTIDVQLVTSDGSPLAGEQLVSGDPDTIVAPAPGKPDTWRVTTHESQSPWITLVMLDGAKHELERATFARARPAALGLCGVAGTYFDAPGAPSHEATAGQPFTVQICALAAGGTPIGRPLIGRFTYDITADPDGLMAHEQPGADVAEGELAITGLPAGTYHLTAQVHDVPTLHVRGTIDVTP